MKRTSAVSSPRLYWYLERRFSAMASSWRATFSGEAANGFRLAQDGDALDAASNTATRKVRPEIVRKLKASRVGRRP